MFDVILLDKLTDAESREAITKPVQDDPDCPIKFNDYTVDRIVQMSGGYPYFIQFICKEVFDIWISKLGLGQDPSVPEAEILRKLDQRFFSGRWEKASDRQREFMMVITLLPNSSEEISVQDIVDSSRELLSKPFKAASAGMMLKTLIDNEFIFRNRRGKYSFAVPLLNRFILRQMDSDLPRPIGENGASVE